MWRGPRKLLVLILKSLDAAADWWYVGCIDTEAHRQISTHICRSLQQMCMKNHVKKKKSTERPAYVVTDDLSLLPALGAKYFSAINIYLRLYRFFHTFTNLNMD